MLDKIDTTKIYNITFKIKRKEVKIIGETDNAIKILPANSSDLNRIAHISKKNILDIEPIGDIKKENDIGEVSNGDHGTTDGSPK